MRTFDFIVDDPAARIHALMREFGICFDMEFRSEIMRLLELPGFRRAYFRKRGLTVDALAEMICERRITGRRLDCVETLDVLDMVLTVRDHGACDVPKRSRRSSGKHGGQLRTDTGNLSARAAVNWRAPRVRAICFAENAS